MWCERGASVFAIRFSRGSAVAKEMLGEAFRGFLVSDRRSAYTCRQLLQQERLDMLTKSYALQERG